jgi:transposase
MAQKISVLGIDLAKLVFHGVGMDDTGHVVLRKCLARSESLSFIAKWSLLRIGMEACGSAHDWARHFREHGHEVRLIAPQFVKAYVKSPKNDTRDAKAICEAMSRPTMRFVAIKQSEQQDLQALHRVRERLIKARTALVNEIRGLLNEHAKLTALSTEVFWHLYDEFLSLEKRLAYYDEKLAAMGPAHPECQRLQTLPGIRSKASGTICIGRWIRPARRLTSCSLSTGMSRRPHAS